MRFAFLSLSLLTAVALAGCASETADAPPPSEGTGEAEQSASGRVGSHGMVLFGDRDATYVSHIPMFGARIHDVQVITQIALREPPPSVPPTFSDRLYTFLPDRMSLDALRLGTLRTMRGTIFLGNFETPAARPVASNVSVDVLRVIHQHELVANEPLPSSSEYFLFGTQEKAFAVHRISGAPGFDHVAAVELGARKPSAVDLADGVLVTLAGVQDAVATRLAGAGEVATTSASFDIESVLELSCLVGDGFTEACE